MPTPTPNPAQTTKPPPPTEKKQDAVIDTIPVFHFSSDKDKMDVDDKMEKPKTSTTTTKPATSTTTSTTTTTLTSLEKTEDANGKKYEVGNSLILMFNDHNGVETPRAVEVIEVKCVKSVYYYYIHYIGYNRRLDEWLSQSQLLGRKQKVNDVNVSIRSLSNSSSSTKERTLTRNQKRRYDEMNHVQKSFDEMDPTTAALEKEHEHLTKVKYINQIIFSKYEMDTWYFSPYPGDYGKVSKLYICEYCLKYMKHSKNLKLHKAKCNWRAPPGREIYRKDSVAVYEINGKESPLYCQSLCLLAKLFLDHKTLFFDVDHFLFYVLCEVDDEGSHIVGYFSKEKFSVDNYNVACILTIPPYQRKGYGKLLITFSYELSIIEGKLGSPEKPLSDLGALSYRSYWAGVLLRKLKDLKQQHPPTVHDLANMTGFQKNDIVQTLQSLGLIKFWKDQHVVVFTQKVVDEYLAMKCHRPLLLTVDPKYIDWEGPPTDA